jgi:murein tripeptide amidase MpaA
MLISGGGMKAQWNFEGDTSATWQEAIARYTYLDSIHAGAKLITIGQDDDGHSIHLFIISDGSGFTPDSIRATGKNILWITNGIHPGEPDGIDASLILAQALLESDQLMGLLVNTAVCIVPVYNVSGALNRGSFSRANQDGPKEYGFRGNAKNLDLNRDFMKMD